MIQIGLGVDVTSGNVGSHGEADPGNTLLLETGDDLLLEDGPYLLLEV